MGVAEPPWALPGWRSRAQAWIAAHDRGRLVAAYLEPWAGHGSGPQLRAALDLALRPGPLTCALAWSRVLAGLPPAAAGGCGGALDAWLGDLETELDRR